MISTISKKLKSQGFDRALLISTEDFIDKNKFMIWFYEERFLSDKSLTFAADFEEENKTKVMIPSNESIEKLKEIKYNKLLPFVKEKKYDIKINIINLKGEPIDLDEKTMNKIEKIASKHLETVRMLKTRIIDDLNFHTIAIWNLKKVLVACYKLGFKDGKDSQEEKQKDDYMQEFLNTLESYHFFVIAVITFYWFYEINKLLFMIKVIFSKNDNYVYINKTKTRILLPYEEKVYKLENNVRILFLIITFSLTIYYDFFIKEEPILYIIVLLGSLGTNLGLFINWYNKDKLYLSKEKVLIKSRFTISFRKNKTQEKVYEIKHTENKFLLKTGFMPRYIVYPKDIKTKDILKRIAK